MIGMRSMGRRAFGRLLGAAALAGVLSPKRALAARLDWDAQPGPECASKRRYRADAVVVLLSVPVLHRSGVGGGSAAWSEAAGVRMLEFNGYSLPERAAGLRRMGFVRELARQIEDGAESIYFGLMTASPEESAAEARKALHQQSKTLLYSAIDGRVTPGHVETTDAQFSAPVELSLARIDELSALARQALASASAKPPEFDPRTANERTFLQSLAWLLQEKGASETRYIYNGRRYRLWLHKIPDSKATAYFREKRLIPAEANVIRAEGKLHREVGGKEINFQVWVEEAAARPIPLRIEYQAKSYLRLMFETE